MSEEKPKPFAVAIPYDWRAPEGWGTHAVQFNTPEGDRLVWPGNEDYARASAERLSRAVEQREARLVAPLHACLQALQTIGRYHAQGVWGEREALEAADRAIADAVVALEGRGDYVPRAALVEAEAKVKALQAVNDLITDVLGDDRLHLQNAREVAAQAAAHLEAAGLRKPDLATLSDDELIQRQRALALEAGRRSAEAAMRPGRQMEIVRELANFGFIPPRDTERVLGFSDRTCPHCDDLPYDGPTRACPTCGIDRHGVGHGAA